MTMTQEQYEMINEIMINMMKEREANMTEEERIEAAIKLRLQKAREAALKREYVELIADLERTIVAEQEDKQEIQEEETERMITLNLDKEYNESKPQAKQIKAIQSRIGASKTTLTVEELATYLHNGSTMKAAALNGNKNADWESQEVFAIDIDNDEKSVKKYGYVAIDDILARCEAYNIKPAFYYTSFSHKEEHHKFRLVFISASKITDIRVRNVIQMALMNIFPECDKACKDLSRVFFGSKHGCHILDTKANITVMNTVQAMTSFIRATMSDSAASKSIKAYCQTVGLNMINGVPQIEVITDEVEELKNGKTTPSLIYILLEQESNFQKYIKLYFNIEEGQYSIRVANTEGKAKGPKCDIEANRIKADKLIEGFDFDTLEDRCQLYSEFISGSRWCYHEEVFGMATNLWRFNQGQQRMIEAIENNNDYMDKFNKINTIRTASKAQYEPMRCSNFCPYKDNCKNQGLNILHIMDAKRNDIRQIEEIEAKDIIIAYEETEEAITDAIVNDNNSNKITVIKAPTGIGKSTMLQVLANSNPYIFDNAAIAAPTHDLLVELVNKLKEDLPNLVHVNEVEIPDADVATRYNTFLSTGQYGSAKGVLDFYINKLLVETKDKPEERKKVQPIINNINSYLEAAKEARTTHNPVFCTHKRMSVLNNPNIDKYIVDEDIISTVIQNITIGKETRGDIANAAIVAQAQGLNDLYAHFTSLLNFLNKVELTQGVVVEYEAQLKAVSLKDMKKLLDNFSPNCNLMDMLTIKAAVKSSNGTITAYKKNDLPNKPIIILSATANEQVYKAVFADREVEVIDIGNVEHVGEVIVHYQGMSRNYLNQYFDKAVDKIKAEAPGIENIITYKSFSNKFKKEGFNPICHYGKCTGIDAYGGQDLIVIGTPHVNAVVYLLMAHACGVKETITMDMEFVNIKRNGYEFSFSTFNSHDLSPTGELIREIQFYLIESDIIQAVGRARALRKDCKVHLFSNYPLRGSKIFK